MRAPSAPLVMSESTRSLQAIAWRRLAGRASGMSVCDATVQGRRRHGCAVTLRRAPTHDCGRLPATAQDTARPSRDPCGSYLPLAYMNACSIGGGTHRLCIYRRSVGGAVQYGVSRAAPYRLSGTVSCT